MSLEISLPLGKKKTAKNLIFSILSKEYPLKLIELTNYIKKRYGVSITFQAVRKAVFELIEEGVLIQKEKEFMINKEWVKQAKAKMDELHLELNSKKSKTNSIDSIKGEISVFTFNSLNEMMKFWHSLMENWIDNIKTDEPKINCYQSAHIWEALLHLDKESDIMNKIKDKKIKSYAISNGNTPLDQNIFKLYNSIGVKTLIVPSSSSFDKSHYIGTYGNMIVQAQFPKELVELIDEFFKKNKTIEQLDFNELTKIVNKKTEIKLTVINNKGMAQQINKSIIDQFS